MTGRYGTLGEVFYIEQDFWPLNITLYVRDFKGNDPRFVSYFLRTLNLASQNTAGAVPGLNRNALHLLPVAVPPLRIQQRIAEILSAYDDLIENNTRRIAILEEMARALYHEWFVDFRFPGHEQVAMVEVQFGSVLEGWEVGRLSDIAEIARGGINPARFPDEIFAHYSIPAFDEGRLPVHEEGDTIRSNKFLVREECVLLSKLNPRIPRVWLPFPDGAVRSVASTEFLVLVPRAPVDSTFLYGLLQSEKFRGDFSGRALGTSTSHQRVKPEDFLAMPVVVPAEDVLAEFSDTVAPLLQLAHVLRLKNAKLRRTRDLLLPKLISGELNIDGLDVETHEVKETSLSIST